MTKFQSGKVVCQPGSFWATAGANRQIQGLRGRRPTHYHHASWQGGFLHSILFSLAQATWQTVRAHCDPEEGKSLTWRWSPRVLSGPQGPCRRPQRKGRERSVRSFGPWSCKKSGKSSLGPARTPQHAQQAVNDRVGLSVRRSRLVCRKSRYYAGLCRLMQEKANTVCIVFRPNPLLLPCVHRNRQVVFSSVARYTG